MKGTSLLQRLTKSVPRKSGLIQLTKDKCGPSTGRGYACSLRQQFHAVSEAQVSSPLDSRTNVNTLPCEPDLTRNPRGSVCS